MRQYKTTCPDCQKFFCANCNLPWHEGMSCEDAKRLHGFDWDKIGDKTAGNAHRCPKCKSPFEKTTGCVHMTCPVCEHEWCWVCGLPFHSIIHYGQGMGLMCEIIGGIHFSKDSAWTQFWLMLIIFILMPLILLLITGLVGFMMSYFFWEENLKDFCLKLLNLRQPNVRTMREKIKNIGVLVMCFWLFSAMALVLLAFGFFLWVILYTVFLVPCMILYIIVAVRK